MHMGFPFLEETKALMKVYPQVYVDISAIDWLIPVEEFHAYLKSLVVAGFAKRIMYGFDQMIWDDAVPLSIKNVESAAFLNERQKADIFYNNAAEFLASGSAAFCCYFREYSLQKTPGSVRTGCSFVCLITLSAAHLVTHLLAHTGIMLFYHFYLFVF